MIGVRTERFISPDYEWKLRWPLAYFTMLTHPSEQMFFMASPQTFTFTIGAVKSDAFLIVLCYQRVIKGRTNTAAEQSSSCGWF